jgi:hypothetical protein
VINTFLFATTQYAARYKHRCISPRIAEYCHTVPLNSRKYESHLQCNAVSSGKASAFHSELLTRTPTWAPTTPSKAFVPFFSNSIPRHVVNLGHYYLNKCLLKFLIYSSYGRKKKEGKDVSSYGMVSRKIPQFEKGSTRSHCLKNSLGRNHGPVARRTTK